MEKESINQPQKSPSMPEGFSRFTWAIAAFCLPIFLWPLASLVSTNLEKNPALSQGQVRFMYLCLWLYPFVLAIVARICYKLNQRNHNLAKKLLIASTIAFYGLLYYIVSVGFGA
ncbi:DUF5389 domain-containing protein [Mannheimia massilioguelmaensis]|uniref:DUF5389 domain-containing protein n=1 Tax=Mannheimia massilioguelmaensis TaxID=1604354 RepID=UPI0005C9B99D|nr:DUF5389 domain-containing protein [Mannheimia massilioguelmaensis]